eukprot:763658-Hanusia_phi.AAC.12
MKRAVRSFVEYRRASTCCRRTREAEAAVTYRGMLNGLSQGFCGWRFFVREARRAGKLLALANSRQATQSKRKAFNRIAKACNENRLSLAVLEECWKKISEVQRWSRLIVDFLSRWRQRRKLWCCLAAWSDLAAEDRKTRSRRAHASSFSIPLLVQRLFSRWRSHAPCARVACAEVKCWLLTSSCRNPSSSPSFTSPSPYSATVHRLPSWTLLSRAMLVQDRGSRRRGARVNYRDLTCVCAGGQKR